MFFILSPVQNEKPEINRLIDNYSKNLMRLCYLYLKDYHLAEDAVQDTLTKAYVKYNTFNKNSSEKTWITRIAINVCKNYLRKSSNKEFSSNECVLLSFASNEESEANYRDEESILLLNAVYSLPEIYKQVILLYYYQNLRITEISKILKQKDVTISVRLLRARKLLKEFLKEE